MSPTGTHTKTDVPESEVPREVAGFKAQGAEVTTKKQSNGLWTVIAKFPDK